MDRRTFIQGAGLIALPSALAALFPLSSGEQPHAALTNASAHRIGAATTDADLIVFTIEGWDQFDVIDPSRNGVSIRINQSWRAAWR